MRTVLIRSVVVLVVLYVLIAAVLGWAMRQPPETFGRVMAKMPGVTFLLFPFESMWVRARAGTLQSGNPAPDFALETLDKTGRVQLSSFAVKHQPVVLVFGSYT
jgi:hypothetical protein